MRVVRGSSANGRLINCSQVHLKAINPKEI